MGALREGVYVGGDLFSQHNLQPNPGAWQEVPLVREGDCWSVFVFGALADSLYKFRILADGDGGDRHAVDQYRHDPYCRDAVSFGGNSVVVDRQFDWKNGFQMPPWNELIVYELQIGTFAKDSAGRVATLQQGTDRLGHAAFVGFNAVEVLPAFDFDTEMSIGYNPALPFAIDNAYGELSAISRCARAAPG